jgi:hypothetical protein
MKMLAALLVLLVPAQDGKVTLRWKWEKGRELLYRNVQTQTIEAGGAVIEQQTAMTYSMTVQEVDEKGIATLRMKYEAMAAKGSGLVEFEYDSEKDKEAPQEPQVATLAKLVGQQFTLKMAPTGKVTDVAGFEKIMELLLKGMEEGPQAQMMRAMLKQTFSDDAMKSNFQQMAPLLPEAAVGKGDTWKDDYTFKMAMLGGMKFAIASTLSEVKDGRARIAQDYAIQVKIDEKPDPENPLAGAGVEFKDSKGKAELVFSIADGCLESQKVDMTMVVVMAAAGQEMPIKTKNEMLRVERKKKF